MVRQPWFDKDYAEEEAAHMWHGGAGRSWREEVTTYYSFEVVSKLMALVDAKAARIARDLGVEQIDLMPLLDRSLEVFYDTFHATPAGSRLVAAAVAATILRQPLQEVATDTDIHGAVEAAAAIEKVSSEHHDHSLHPGCAADRDRDGCRQRRNHRRPGNEHVGRIQRRVGAGQHGPRVDRRHRRGIPTAQARAELAFTGTRVSWIGFRGPQAGKARVFVDGALKTTVDTYAAAEQLQAVLYTSADALRFTRTRWPSR